MTRKTSRRIVLGLLLLLLLYPFQSRVVPAWKLRVVDEQGQPVAGMQVTYTWQDYGIEWSDSADYTVTDATGILSFPERTTRASLLQRGLRGFSNVIALPHSSSNRSGFIVVWGKPEVYETGQSGYDGEGTPPEQIVLERVRK